MSESEFSVRWFLEDSMNEAVKQLTRIADALEAMKPQTVEATLEEFDSAGFAQAIAEALKRPGVRSVDISAPHDMGGLHRISDGGAGDDH